MANSNTTTAAKWVDQKWDAIDVAAYEEQIYANLIKERKSSHGQLHVPFHANVSTGAVSAGNATSLSFSANTESEATLSPTTYSAQQEVEMALVVRAVQDPEGVLQESLKLAIAQVVDQQALTLVASLSTNIVNAAGGIDNASILSAIRAGAQGGKQFWYPGKANAFCVVHVGQIDNMLAITNIVQAQWRGDRVNPIETGWVANAYRVDFYESGNVYTTGGTAYSVMQIPRSTSISYNQRPKVMVQEYQMANRIICWTDFAVGIIRDAYAVAITHPV